MGQEQCCLCECCFPVEDHLTPKTTKILAKHGENVHYRYHKYASPFWKGIEMELPFMLEGIEKWKSESALEEARAQKFQDDKKKKKIRRKTL